jgi:hypothetical protein
MEAMCVQPTRRRGAILPSIHAVLLFIGMLVAVAVQAQTKPMAPADSTTRDTTGRIAGDTVRSADSIRRATPIPRHGAPLGAIVDRIDAPGVSAITKQDQAWRRYFTAFDLLQGSLPAYPLSQGAPGLVRAFSYAGASPDAISSLFNGRPLRAPDDRAYDIELFPMEFIERTEILQGARAVLYGSGESLIALNFVQPRFDVDGSYVRLWYAQGENNLTGADISYARNVGRGSNLTFGFRRLPSDGEFPNQRVSNWAAHAALTWNPIETLELSLSEIYSDGTRGLNGGLLASSSRTSLAAQVYDNELKERSLRHDATLSAHWFPRMIDATVATPVDTGSKHTLVDTTFHIDADLYYSYAERNLLISGSSGGDSTYDFLHRDLLGTRFALALPLAFARLEGNGIAELRAGRGIRLEAGGMLELRAGDRVALRGVARLFKDQGNSYTLFAGEGVLGFGDSLSLRATLRQRIDLESAGPEGLIDTVRYFDDGRTRLLGEAALDWRNGDYRLGVTAFLRRVDPLLGYGGLEPHTVSGASLHLRLPLLLHITLDNTLLGTIDPAGDGRFPAVYGSSDLFGQWTLFNGNLDLRVGTSLEYQSALRGAEYQSETGRFIFPGDPDRATFTPFPNWTAYIHGRIGSAFIRVGMRNILDAEFLTLYRYPQWGRELNLEVTWALID